jgi:hypothetical protein
MTTPPAPMENVPPIPVHVASIAEGLSSSSASSPGPAPRKQQRLQTNTFFLTAANPVAQVWPPSVERVYGAITAAIAASNPPVVFVATNQADAQQQGGGAAQINGLDTAPFPLSTTDAVWISAASLPATVSVVAVYEQTG